MGLGHGSGFNRCWLPSTSRTLNCNVAKTVHKGPGRRRFPSLLLLRVERSSSTRRTFVSVRSPPRGHAHAAHVPPHPNAALPREPGFAVLPCAGCQSSPDVRDWSSPVTPLTRVGGTAVRCVLSPCVLSEALLLSPAVSVSASPLLPPLILGEVVVGTDEVRLGTGSSRIRHATVRWHHSSPPKGIDQLAAAAHALPASSCSASGRPGSSSRIRTAESAQLIGLELEN